MTSRYSSAARRRGVSDHMDHMDRHSRTAEIIRSTEAYPYGKEWVDNLLDELPEAPVGQLS
jgi:hypothetical protein